MTNLEKAIQALRFSGYISLNEGEAIRQCIEVHADEVDEYDSAIPQDVRDGIRELLQEETPR